MSQLFIKEFNLINLLLNSNEFNDNLNQLDNYLDQFKCVIKSNININNSNNNIKNKVLNKINDCLNDKFYYLKNVLINIENSLIIMTNQCNDVDYNETKEAMCCITRVYWTK